jgi:hypothetical protein
MSPATVTPRIVGRLALAVAFVSAGALLVAANSTDSVSGSISYKTHTKDFALTPTHVYLLKGRDPADPGTAIRRLVVTTEDLDSEIQACKTLRCVTDGLKEGLTVDFDAGSGLGCWLVLDNKLVQYSAAQGEASFKAKADTAGRMAGTLTFDKTAAGGPNVNVTFDVALTKDFDQQP